MNETILPPARVKIGQINDKGASVVLQNIRLAFVKIAEPAASQSTDAEGKPIKHFYEITALIPKKGKVIEQLQKAGSETIKLFKDFSDAPRKDKKGKPLPSERQEAMNKLMIVGEEKHTFKDGDEELSKSTEKPYDGCADHYTLKLKMDAVQNEDGTFKPKFDLKLLFADKSPIRKHEIAGEIYSGVWADVSFSLSPYNYPKGNVGVTGKLWGILKLKDDVKLGGVDPFDDRSDIVPTSNEEDPEEVQDY